MSTSTSADSLFHNFLADLLFPCILFFCPLKFLIFPSTCLLPFCNTSMAAESIEERAVPDFPVSECTP